MCFFFYLSGVQVISTNFLHGITRLSDPNEVENVGKVREKDSETPKQETTGEWRKQELINGLRKDPEFCVYLEGEVADEKCFRGRQTFFLVELIHTVVSTVETRHRHPIPPFTVTQLAIYIFLCFLVVFFFIIQD